MKIFAAPALLAALALGACSEADAPEPAETETVVDETVVTTPEPTTVVIEEGAMADGDSVTIGENGVEAQIGDDDTRMRADVDGDPTLTVETD